MRMAVMVCVFVLLTATMVLLVYAQQTASVNAKLEGSKPYTPTPLEWLAVTLNANYRTDMVGDGTFSISFVDIGNEDTILIYVRYMRSTNREAMNIGVDAARKVLDIEVKSRGWDSWVKVREKVELAPERASRK